MGIERAGAVAHRRRAGAGHRRRGRSVRVHRGQLVARYPFSLVGARGRPGGDRRSTEDPATWTKIKDEIRGLLAERGLSDLSFAVVASYSPDPSLNGLSMKQVALKLHGSDSPDTQLEAARVMMLGGGASMVYHLMSDDDVDRIMRHPEVAVASDSSVLGLATASRTRAGTATTRACSASTCAKRHVIPIEEAIRKMTSLPAEHFRFEKRGLLKPGYAADVTIFDPTAVVDTASFEKPHSFAAGIPYVLVNGVVVVRKGEHTGALAGQTLRIANPK